MSTAATLPDSAQRTVAPFALLERTFDAELVNWFANHPEIRPGLSGADPLDLAPAMNDANVFLFGDHGGFVFTWSAPQTYEVHVVITEAGRGRWGLDAAQEAVAAMVAAGATHLWTRAHPDRREIAFFAIRAGFRECGVHVLDMGEGPVAWRLFDWRLGCLSH